MLQVILLGIGLAMDAFAVSIANGLKYKNYKTKEMIIASVTFGLFQGAMPAIGYLLFSPFMKYVEKFDHWLVFGILLFLGVKMIKDSFEKDKQDENETFTIKILLFEAFATAIDALSVGVTLPSMEPPVWWVSCIIIAVITTVICLIGHFFGKKFASVLKDKAMIFGGVILILIGLKTLLEHLGVF